MTPMFIRAVPAREACVRYLQARLPDATVIWDDNPGHGAFGTFNAALRAAGDRPSLHLEDDITLCRNFTTRVEQALSGHRNEVVQFFSMKAKGDLAVGSRYLPGRTFMMTQCFYLPAGIGPAIVRHTERGDRPTVDPSGIDMAVGDFLQSIKARYWLHCPSLVQHNEGRSMLGPRSSRRQSPTFTDPDEDRPEGWLPPSPTDRPGGT